MNTVDTHSEEILPEAAAQTELKGERFETLSISVNSKLGKWISPVILVIADYLAIVAALLSSFYLRNVIVYHDVLTTTKNFEAHIYFIIPLIYIGLMIYQGLYVKRVPLWQKMEHLFKVSVVATILTIGIMYFNHSASIIPRVFIGLSSIVCFFYLLGSRYLTKQILMFFGLWQQPVLLIGAGKSAELVAEALEEDFYTGYKIVGLVDDNYLRKLANRYPLLGGFKSIETVIQNSGIKDVIIALPELKRERLLEIVYRIQPLVRRVSVVPDLHGLPLSNIDINSFYNQKTVLLNLHNNLLKSWNRLYKRMFDIIVGTIALLLASPIMLLLVVLIRLDSKGKAVFSHKRVGRNGKLFPCYKFRTMVANAQGVLEQHLQENPDARAEWEQEFKLKDDPRITKIGKLLRKTSLDELPQLLNIIKGEMSLVGPRPIVTQEISKYNENISDYYMVRPGLTGLWQVNGRNDISYETRVQMDSWYVRNWSFWLDVTLLLKTFQVVLRRKGAY